MRTEDGERLLPLLQKLYDWKGLVLQIPWIIRIVTKNQQNPRHPTLHVPLISDVVFSRSARTDPSLKPRLGTFQASSRHKECMLGLLMSYFYPRFQSKPQNEHDSGSKTGWHKVVQRNFRYHLLPTADHSATAPPLNHHTNCRLGRPSKAAWPCSDQRLPAVAQSLQDSG